MIQLLRDLAEAFDRRGLDISFQDLTGALTEAFEKNTSVFEAALSREPVMAPDVINQTRVHAMETIFKEILTRPNIVAVEEKLDTMPNDRGVFRTRAVERFRVMVVHMGEGGRAALKPARGSGKVPADS